jgi:hypothetical protein
VRRCTAWLTEEGELPADPFLGITGPKLDTAVVEPLSEDDLRALLRACQPPTGATPAETLRHRRDEAILRLMLETGARAGEVVALDVTDLDLPVGTALIRRGKAAGGGSSCSGRTRPGPWTATCACAPGTGSADSAACGSGTVARASPTTRGTRPSDSGPTPPASPASTRTRRGTPPRTGGSLPALLPPPGTR